MSVILCRTCGRELVFSPGVELVCCPACSTNNCSPQADADVADVLNRATGQRLRCDFIHAEASYQYALNISPEEPEALWGLVQCRYGVEYVNDPRTGRPIPIVHAVRKRPMLTDPDFREACELAPEAVRDQYRNDTACTNPEKAGDMLLPGPGRREVRRLPLPQDQPHRRRRGLHRGLHTRDGDLYGAR